MERVDAEYEEMLQNLTETQERCNELLKENRAYKAMLQMAQSEAAEWKCHVLGLVKERNAAQAEVALLKGSALK